MEPCRGRPSGSRFLSQRVARTVSQEDLLSSWGLALVLVQGRSWPPDFRESLRKDLRTLASMSSHWLASVRLPLLQESSP